MRVATWVGGAGVLLAIILIVVLSSGERTESDLIPLGGDATDAPALAQPNGAAADDSTMMLSEPDREVYAASQATAITEKPPRTTFGIIPVERSIELPVVDPETLSYDADIGRIETSSVTPPSNPGPGETNDPMFAPGHHVVETNDGPLGGRIARPDPAAPGPAGPSVSGSTSVPNNSNPGSVLDPLGPGQPIDPVAAAAAPPNYVLPGAGVTIGDPDSSAGAPDNDESN